MKVVVGMRVERAGVVVAGQNRFLEKGRKSRSDWD
jgi:hypothetical protein